MSQQFREMLGGGRARAKQKQGGASNVRAKGDAYEGPTGILCLYQGPTPCPAAPRLTVLVCVCVCVCACVCVRVCVDKPARHPDSESLR
jgi:hypothetical protein